MPNYSALIIDDEDDCIQLIELYLKKYCKEITKYYFATNIKDGIELFLLHKPNLLFLDIDLKKGGSTFELIDKYDLEESKVIFVTSYVDFAPKVINNIENVSGYIMKPINVVDLVNAVTKTFKKIETHKGNTSKQDQYKFIAIPALNKVDLLRIEDILYCCAEGKYTMFHTVDNEIYTSSKNMGEFLEVLHPEFFFRIHHKYIINIQHIKHLSKTSGYFCQLVNGKNLPISKRKAEDFNKFIKIRF